MRDIDKVVTGCWKRVWHTEYSQRDFYIGQSPTMLSHGERLMLHWLGMNFPIAEEHVIIDAGCFLGGSTSALAVGANRRATRVHPGLIHTYDMFIAPNDAYSLDLIGGGRTPGNSVRDIFDKALHTYRDLITVHEGDIMKATVPMALMAILFVDVAKTREINARIVRDFFPRMVAGETILIQQDFNDHSCPWTNASMEKLASYFEHLCDEGGSRVYLYTKKIPAKVLESAATVVAEEEFKLLMEAADKEKDKRSEFFIRVAAGWPLFETQGIEAVKAYYHGIANMQPWEGDSYVEIVLGAMSHLKNAEGLEKYHSSYFAGADRLRFG